MSGEFIPVCEPFLNGNEKKYALDAIESGWISSSGKYVNQFEKSFSEYCGVNHGIAVCNGTVALHLALVAIGIGKGDEVIIPNFTMIASAFAVCYTGAVPVFVDAEGTTWNIDISKIEEKITSRTRAIMPVHIYGHPCDMNGIIEIAKKHGLRIIEDAAEVHGAEYHGARCGSLGDIACFSFFANKILTTGEGGMVITNDQHLADRCRYFKNLCFPLTGSRNYMHDEIGFNYRMSNVHAALGLAQTERIGEYIELRRKNHKLYRETLAEIPGLYLQPEEEGCKNVYWMNGLVINKQEFGINRDTLMKKLFEQGIDSRYFFRGMNKQAALLKYGCNTVDEYPVTDWLADNGLYLPSGTGLQASDIDRICSVLYTIHRENK
jgi:perosamine synthetase